MLPQDYDGIFKIILVGNSGVGKSSILNQYFVQEFFEKFKSTIGVDLKIKSKTMPNQRLIKIQLYDTAGQEKFKSIVSSYYKGAQGVFLVYDITNRNSFNDINTWYNDIKQYSKQDVEIILVGNKNDLVSKRSVSTQDGEKLAQDLNCYFIETTAKEYQSVDEAFNVILNVIYEKEIQNKQDSGRVADQKIKVNLNTSNQELDLIDINNKQKKCC